MSPARGPVVFLDRDGTINREVGYLCRPEEAELLPGAGAAIARLNRAGRPVVVVSNQSGVARGLYGPEDVVRVNRELARQLAAHGARVDGWYHCPHLPAEKGGVVAGLAVVCACRKPKPGMFLRAAAELGLDLAGGCMIGDHRRDVAAGNGLGLTTVLVLSGHPPREAQSPEELPDRVAPDLAAAVAWLLDGREPA